MSHARWQRPALLGCAAAPLALWAVGDRPALVLPALASLLWPAWLFFARCPWPALTDDDRRGGWGWLLLIVLAAAVTRLLWLAELPRQIDNDAALGGVVCDQLLELPEYQALLPDREVESGFYYAMAVLQRPFGFSVWALRMPAVLLNLLGLLALFWFARELAGRRVALLAVLFAAAAPWSLALARSSKHPLPLLVFVPLTYGCLLRGLRTRAWGWYLAAGLLCGVSMHCYQGYRHGVIAAPLFVLLMSWRRLEPADEAAAPGTSPRIGACLTLLAALLPMAPMLWRIAADLGRGLEPLLEASSLGGGDPLGALVGAGRAAYTALVWLPAMGHGSAALTTALLLGAAPLLLRADRRGWALLLLLALMIGPPLVGRYHQAAPRRYVALYAVLFLLPAIAVGRLLAGETARWRRLAIAWLAAGVLVMGAGGWHVLIGMDGSQGVWDHADREQLLRAAGRYADATGEQVVLPAGFQGEENYTLQYLLLHPRVTAHEAGHPAALPADQPRLVVPADTAIGAQLRALRPDARPRRLPLPGLIAREPTSAPAWWLPPREVPDRLPRSGWLAVPRSGRYRIETPEGCRGRLLLGEQRWLELSGLDDAPTRPLAAGVVRFRFEPAADSRPWFPGWRPHDPAEGPLPPLLSCVYPDRRGAPPFRPAPLAPAGCWLRALGELELPPYPGEPPHNPAQDMARLADGSLIACRYERFERLVGDEFQPLDLRGPDGASVRFAFDYDRVPPKVWSIAGHPDGDLLVLRRPRRFRLARLIGEPPGGRWLRRFAPDGRFVAELPAPPGGWRDPLDVAVAADGRVAVADAGRGELVVYDARGQLQFRHRVGRPVSLAWVGDQLIYADRHGLRLRRLGADNAGVFVGRLDEEARLEWLPQQGWLLLSDRGRLLAFDAQLRQLTFAPETGGLDPVALRRPPRWAPLAAAQWEQASERLALLDAAGRLERFELSPRFVPDRALELPASSPSALAGPYTRRRFPDALAARVLLVDSGAPERVARFRYALPAGRHTLWLRYACPQPRRVTLRVGEQTFALTLPETHGDTPDQLAWHRVGALDLVAGVHVLVIEGERLPAIERFALMRVHPGD